MCNKIALIVDFNGQVTHNGPGDIVLFKTDIALDMSRSYNHNILSEMNDN